MTGAVDLAAVKARSEAEARAAEAPRPAAGHFVVDITEATFQAEVLDRSFQVPVLLDLSSPRAAGSAEMTPILEKIATEANGAFVLAKIDVDANVRIAQALQLQAVPAVFAVIKGQLVPGFEGVLPEEQLREFVGAVLQAARDAGMTITDNGPAPQDGAATPEPQVPEDPRFDAAEEALADGDYDLARQRFQAILDSEPANSVAQLALHQVALLQRVATLSPDAALRADENPADVALGLAAADLHFVGDDADAALRRLLDLLPRTSGDDRDAVRQRLLEYFDLLGNDDPRVPAARREMARALF